MQVFGIKYLIIVFLHKVSDNCNCGKKKDEVNISFKNKWQPVREGEMRKTKIKVCGVELCWVSAIRAFGYGGGFGWRNCIS